MERVSSLTRGAVRCRSLLWMFSLAWVSVLEAVPAGDVRTLFFDSDRMRPGTALYFFLDASGEMDFSRVSARDFDGFRQRTGNHAPNWGFYSGAVWLRLRLAAPVPRRVLLEIDNPTLDRVQWFFPGPNGVYSSRLMGDNFPFEKRLVPHRLFVLPAEIGPDPRDFYVRIETISPLVLPMRLMSPETFHASDRINQIVLGLYYGIALVMIFYNLILSITLRDRNYLEYSFYIAAFAGFMFVLNGIASEVIWPTRPRMNDIGAVSCAASSLLFGALFGRNFLRTRSLPRHDLVIKVLMVLALSPVLVYYSPGDNRRIAFLLVNLLSIGGAGTILSAGIAQARLGYRPARYYLVGWTVFLAGVIIYSLRNLGFVPDGFFTYHGMQIGSALEMILLSLALGYRFNALREEKDAAERDTLRQRLRLLDSFARFVPREFLKFLGRADVTEISAGDSNRLRMTVLFTDIRGFTSLSEERPAREIFQFLNEYLARMEPAIHEHGGFIDKFIGDAILALFPEEAGSDGALLAALAMQKELERFNAERQGTGMEPITIGIGVHHGELALGTLGSPRRLETTVIGDTVNVASRLENLTKQFATGLLLSADARAVLRAPDTFVLREIDTVRVQGKKKPLVVYELMGTRIMHETKI